jgi:putative transposase
MKQRYTEEQIIGFLREADAGLPVKELCRKHGLSEPSYYACKAKFGGMSVSDAQRLKTLEAENTKLKKLLANSMLEIEPPRVFERLQPLRRWSPYESCEVLPGGARACRAYGS